MNVVIAGGGTAGHVNPALALAGELSEERITFVGTAAGAETRLVPKEGFDLELLDVIGFDRAQPWRLPATAVRAARATSKAIGLLRELQPDVVVGMGGYVSLPVGLAARRLRKPLVLHEQNIVVGLANRVLKRFAKTVAVSFEETLESVGSRGRVTGNPVAQRLVECDWARERARGVESFGLDPERKTLLIFGGSQGAKSINVAAVGLGDLWAERSDRQVIHIAGTRSEPSTVSAGRLIFKSVDFVERMEEAYAVADLALCRGGATTVAEVAIAGLPSIVVPYPYHRDMQQERHGRVLERAGAAVVIADGSLSPQLVADTADRLLDDDEGLKKMSDSARQLARPQAARDLAEIVRAAVGR